MRVRWGLAGLLSLGCLVQGGAISGLGLPLRTATAQEAAAEAAGDPVEKFREVFARWNARDKQLAEIAEKYAASTKRDEQAKLRKEYLALIAESDAKIAELEKVAQAAFAAAPNLDSEVTKVMIGLVNYHYGQDDFEGATALGKQLQEAGVKEPALLAILGRTAYSMDDYDLAEKLLTAAKDAGKLDPEGRSDLEELPARKKQWAAELAKRERDAAKNDLPRVKIETKKGTIVVELFEEEAPGAVGNFVSLVEKGFYNGTSFHRVLSGFMAQGGDPKGDGTGGPGYQIFCECERPDHRNHFRGTLSMAHAGKDTGGSQFFLTFRATPNLDGRHTAFGRVIEGLPVLALIQRRDPNAVDKPEPEKIVKMEVIRKRDHEYKPKKSADKD